MPDLKLKPPDQQFATAEEIASKLRLSPRRVRQLVEAGIFPKERHGQYDLRKVMKAVKSSKAKGLLKSKAIPAVAAPAPAGTADYEIERTKRIRTQRERDEIRLARERGELISTETFRKKLEQEYSTIREHVLGIPAIAPELEGLNADERRAKLEEKCRAVLNLLSDGEPLHPTRNAGEPGGNGSGAGDGAPGAAPAHEAESERVGGPLPDSAAGQ